MQSLPSSTLGEIPSQVQKRMKEVAEDLLVARNTTGKSSRGKVSAVDERVSSMLGGYAAAFVSLSVVVVVVVVPDVITFVAFVRGSC